MRTVVLTRSQLHSGPVILVNGDHPIPTSSSPKLAAPDRRYPHILLKRQAARALSACIRAAADYAGTIVPVSGWRSQAEQQAIWDDTLAQEGAEFTQSYVARPGCSEHQTGLAIDLGQAAEHIDFIRPHFPDDGVCGAFRRAAAQYGLIQRYTRDKEVVTGIADEPWHFRYVGAPHALLMQRHHLCLEEYIPFLEEGPRLCALKDGRTISVSRLPCPGSQVEIPLPRGCCHISGDNAEGFILTAWGEYI